MIRTLRSVALCAASALVMAVQAQAAGLSFTGTFTRDDEVRVFSFYNAVAAPVTIETFGYAGGVDAAGNLIAAGGFDPVFALFSADGTLIAYGDDGASRLDPVTGAAFDALLTQTLAVGSYFVALSQFDNFAIGPNFGNGFLETGNATFTAAYGCAAGRFCDINGASRSGSFDLSITTVPVPEPGSWALLGAGLSVLWLMRRRLGAGR